MKLQPGQIPGDMVQHLRAVCEGKRHMPVGGHMKVQKLDISSCLRWVLVMWGLWSDVREQIWNRKLQSKDSPAVYLLHLG